LFLIDLPVFQDHYAAVQTAQVGQHQMNLGADGAPQAQSFITAAVQDRVKTPVEKVNGTYIQEITCGSEMPGNAQTLFGPTQNFTGGWSHINNPEKAPDFVGLKQPYGFYDIKSTNLVSDPTCGGESTYQTILVKKFHTWDNTHSNGLETQIEGDAVGRIQSLVIEMKINSARSVIPSPREIETLYPNLNSTQLASLDSGLANIDLVFSTGNWRSNKILTIDPRLYADKWLRITIPMEKMNYYREVNYVRTYTSYRASKGKRYKGLIINAESQNGQTLQRLTGGKPGQAKLFKEVDIAIHRIAYLMK